MADQLPVLEVRDLQVGYGAGPTATPILHGINLEVRRGHTVGLVGESGSGKSTLAKTLMGLLKPTSGHVAIDGVNLAGSRGTAQAELRRRVQLIPQDPYSSFDPRRTLGAALAEAVDPKRANIRKHEHEILGWLDLVRLPADTIRRYPRECSGGQRQRVAIARALIRRPEIVIADEITSALDVSVQAEILDLMASLRAEYQLTMVFISHNLAVVQQVSDEVAVMYRGRLVEYGSTTDVFQRPRDAYTRTLLAAIPGAPGFSIELSPANSTSGLS